MDTSEYASMFKWYQAFEEQTFGQPPGLRDALRRWSLGLYPGIIKAAMAVFDVVESIAVSRTRICKAGGLHALSRVQVRPHCPAGGSDLNVASSTDLQGCMSALLCYGVIASASYEIPVSLKPSYPSLKAHLQGAQPLKLRIVCFTPFHMSHDISKGYAVACILQRPEFTRLTFAGPKVVIL